MSEDNNELFPISTPGEIVLDTIAVISSIAPWLGGPVATILSGISFDRKIGRVREVLLETAKAVNDNQSEISQKYVKSEDFSELLEKTLRQVAEERSEEKRLAYAMFLAGDVSSPGTHYDEKLRILRTLEEIQPDHIRILNAMLLPPEKNTNLTGSIGQTLQKRLPNIPSERIHDLAQQLTDMKLASLEHINSMMTTSGAEKLENYLTPYGKNFIRHISASRE